MYNQDWSLVFSQYDQQALWLDIEAFTQAAVNVELLAVAEEDCQLGISKVGGLPHLPSTMDWSQFSWTVDWDDEDDEAVLGTETGLGFLAQINCAELRPFDRQNQLPSSGMLYFFYDLQQQPPYLAAQDRGFFKVIYVPEAALAPQSQPESVPSLLKNFRMQFHSVDSLPTHLSPEVKNLKLTPSVLETFMDLRYGTQEPHHQILGYPVPKHFAYPLDQGADRLRNTAINSAQTEWVCLLQLVSSEQNELYWGATEGGTLYFLIHQDDLKNLSFERTLFLMQQG